ncbi:hypothetical protein HDU93_003857 [Gonapodya sp. JEL0774]|nr:hypothetical protein HDU93_003857 [Gonapodya sp. JEL0774]
MHSPRSVAAGSCRPRAIIANSIFLAIFTLCTLAQSTHALVKTGSSGVATGNEFIVGGRNASAATYPFVAILLTYTKDNSKITCTGSLIQTTPVPVILTAAHCGSRQDLEDAEAMGAFVGLDDLTKDCGGKEQPLCRAFRTIDIIQNPGYGSPESHVDDTGHDTALWILAPTDRTVPVTNQVAKVNFDPDTPPVGVNSTAIGWGITNWGGSTASKKVSAKSLQAVSLLVASNSVCERQFDLEVSSRPNIGCLLGGLHRSTCQGDSGGPHVYNGTLWGVTSFGPSTCDNGKAAVVVRTSGVGPWLLATLKKVNAYKPYLPYQYNGGSSA